MLYSHILLISALEETTEKEINSAQSLSVAIAVTIIAVAALATVFIVFMVWWRFARSKSTAGEKIPLLQDKRLIV